MSLCECVGYMCTQVDADDKDAPIDPASEEEDKDAPIDPASEEKDKDAPTTCASEDGCGVDRDNMFGGDENKDDENAAISPVVTTSTLPPVPVKRKTAGHLQKNNFKRTKVDCIVSSHILSFNPILLKKRVSL